MSTLVVVGYNDPYKAEEVLFKLRKLQSEYLLDLEDAVVAVKDEKGKVKLHQAVNLTADGAVSCGFLGSLTGLIFLNAAAGAASGALTDVGINEHFMKELSATLSPRQFNPVRAAKKSHAGQGQGTGRTEGNRRENLEVAGTGATVAASVLKLGH
jgi:uncharacterized membrane protein